MNEVNRQLVSVIENKRGHMFLEILVKFTHAFNPIVCTSERTALLERKGEGNAQKLDGLLFHCNSSLFPYFYTIKVLLGLIRINLKCELFLITVFVVLFAFNFLLPKLVFYFESIVRTLFFFNFTKRKLGTT